MFFFYQRVFHDNPIDRNFALIFLIQIGRYLDHEHQAGSQICHFYAIFMVVFGRVLDQLASAGEIGSCQDGGRREDEARLLSKTACNSLREFRVRKGGTESPTESNFDLIFRYTHAK